MNKIKDHITRKIGIFSDVKCCEDGWSLDLIKSFNINEREKAYQWCYDNQHSYAIIIEYDEFRLSLNNNIYND